MKEIAEKKFLPKLPLTVSESIPILNKHGRSSDYISIKDYQTDKIRTDTFHRPISKIIIIDEN